MSVGLKDNQNGHYVIEFEIQESKRPRKYVSGDLYIVPREYKRYNYIFEIARVSFTIFFVLAFLEM